MLKFYSSLVLILIVKILGTDLNLLQKRNNRNEVLTKWRQGESII